MTVWLTGRWCERCHERPAEPTGICRPCELLLHTFGHTWEPQTISSVHDPGFETALDRWRRGK